MTSQKRMNEIDSISVKYFLTGWFLRKRNRSSFHKIHDETVNQIHGKMRINIISELMSRIDNSVRFKEIKRLPLQKTYFTRSV